MIGVISDVHGNLPALTAVLRRLEQLGADQIICLGDTAGYYCFVNECCDLVRRTAVRVLQGNHDWYLTSGTSSGRSVTVDTCIEYQRTVIADENLEWLGGLRPTAQYAGFSLVHGGWNDPLDEYMSPSRDYFTELAGTRFASGHTHLPLVWRGGGRLYLNPGSVGQPRDGDPRASFATVDGDVVVLHRVEYDFRAVQRAMAATGLPPYIAESLAFGLRVGGRP